VHHFVPWKSRIPEICSHAVDEFFHMGKFLILGSFLATLVQMTVPTSTLLAIGQGKLSSSVVMAALSFLLSICSEADAFIAASFRNSFMASSLVAFMVFGAMLDLKNTLLLFSTFRAKFVVLLLFLVFAFVVFGSFLIGG
jgi:uncharacterized membrane protein YraQ (UPF0718 family)